MKTIPNLFFLLAVLSVGCSAPDPAEARRNPADSPSAPVVVTVGEILVQVEAPITSSAVTQAVLRSPAKGTLVSVPTVGQRVKAGQVVARLDTEALERAIVEAQINVEEAQISLSKQNQTLKLLRSSSESDRVLAASQLITQEDLQTGLANLNQEELQYQLLELSLKKARLALEDAQENRDEAWIKSPVDGIIASVSEDAGTYVEDNTEICQVVDISTITLTGQVDEFDIGKLKTGQGAAAVFEALEGQTFPSRVRTVSPTAQTENNVPVYSITAEVKNPSEIIRPGMSGDLTITISQDQGLVIPKDAVSKLKGRDYVEIWAEGEIRLVPVELGVDDGKKILVVSGLEEGQTLTYQAAAAAKTLPAGSPARPSGSGTVRQNSLMNLGGGPGAGGPPPGGF